MKNWEDIGIVVASKPYGDRYKIVSILTLNHGLSNALANFNNIDKFASFSKVWIRHVTRYNDSIGFWKLVRQDTNCINMINTQNRLLVCQSICFIVNKLLPQNVVHKDIYEFIYNLISNLSLFSDTEMLLLYVYFELFLISNVGFKINDLNFVISQNMNIIKEIISSEQFQDACLNILKITSNVININLANMDNFYRNMILERITKFIMKQKV